LTASVLIEVDLTACQTGVKLVTMRTEGKSVKKKVLTTATDFAKFKSEVKKYQEKYNLGSWEIFYCHEKTEDNSLATVSFDLEAHHAIFTLGKDWSTHKGGKSVNEIRATARHEVRHLLLAKLYLMALSRNMAQEDLDGEIHSIINALECAG
jgi:hypothetical protein